MFGASLELGAWSLELFIARCHIVRYQIEDDDVLTLLDRRAPLFARRLQ